MTLKLKTFNIKKQYDELIELLVSNFQSKKEIEGIVLLGGLGKRRFIDKFSDLDMAIFINTKNIPDYLPGFEFHLKYKNRVLEFNIHQENLINKWNEWPEGKKAVFANGLLVYDKNEKVKKFIERKIQHDETYRKNRIIKIMGQYNWHVNIHTRRALKRGFPETAHYLINDGVDSIIELLFLINKQFMPHKKWSIPFLATFPFVPQDCLNNLKEAMKIKSYLKEDVERRIRFLNKLYQEISMYVKKNIKNFPENPYEYSYKNLDSYQLIKDPYIDRFFRLIENKFNAQEKSDVHGFLSFFLVKSKQELKQVLTNSMARKLLNNKMFSKLSEISD